MKQSSLFDGQAERALLDQLLADSRLYKSGRDYKELLSFTVKLRNVAPFNALLLQVQKPGLRFAASRNDWAIRFNRTIKEAARPLLILWPFGPVATVYDVLDTEGEQLPEDVHCFVARGAITSERFADFSERLEKLAVFWQEFDGGDGNAGYIRTLRRATTKDERNHYGIFMNANHGLATRFVTLVHELGHLFLGHLGSDAKLNIPKRRGLGHRSEELEAESVAYIVAERNGITSKSHTYLSKFTDSDTTTDDLDVYQVTRATGQVETALGLVTHTRFR